MEEVAAGLSEAALRSLVQNAPDGIFVADREDRFIYVNESGCRMLGYARGELIGRSISDLLPSTDVDRLAEARRRMVQGGTHGGEWALRRKDGSWLEVEVSANLLPEGHWHGFVRDISRRKALEAERAALFERVEKKRRWLQTVMDTLPLGLVFFDGSGIVSANRYTYELLGIPPDHAPVSPSYLVMFPDGRPVPTEAGVQARIVQRGETIRGEEYLLRKPDGDTIPILCSAAPIFDEAGAVVVFQDTSERMRLERAVHENERLLQAVFELLPVGVWIANRAGRVIRINPAGERIWRGARYVGIEDYDQYKGWWADSGEPIAARDWPLARAIMRGETSTGETVRIQCFDGSFKTIINSSTPIPEDGGIGGAVTVSEDITALYETQQQLRASDRLFRAVIDLLPVGVWIADKDGRITVENAAGKRIWQGIREAMPEHRGEHKGWWVETGRPLAPDEWAIPRALHKGETSVSELLRIQCFDGSFKTVINWGAPIHNEAGEITGAVAVNEDITALYHTQEQLRAAVREREEILAVVTHDLRNPLSGLILAAMTAERKAARLPGAEELRAAAAMIVDNARSMSALVDDLLAVATAPSGRSMLHITPIKASELMARAAQAAQPLFARAGIKLEVHAPDDLPTLQVDANRILRVLANLLDNAMKFTEREGATYLEAQPVSAGVRISVANTGPALSDEALADMFEPFWQATRKDRRGAGLGLAICRSIIEAHGGSVWAEPAGGMRVRVCFVLPRATTG